MNPLTQQIIDQIILKKSFINNYPKPGVVFLNIDYLFNDPVCRKMVSEAVLSAINSKSFDSVAGIASRGYVFSGMIANRFVHVGEQFIQKVKIKDDPNFVQIDTKTEYSSDALQVLKNTIQKGKKYLLTDDLIATGGSVMTAIQLIRQCGGQVDSVFVMTELLDFGAREKLKKEGVELVSLLQFSNQDLQKLLLIQEAYAENPSTPITYNLTHYTKGEQANTSLTVHLASQSPVKKEATQLAITGIFDPLSIELIGHDSKSGVNKQPFGYEETLKGAANRMQSIKDDMNISISMENGLRYCEEDQLYYDFVHVIVKKGDKTFSHTQDCCKVPTEIIKAIARNEDSSFKETWGDVAMRMGMAKDSNNPHQEAYFGGVSRSQHLFQAMCKALGKLKEQQTKEQVFSLARLFNISNYKSSSYSILVLFQETISHLFQALCKALGTIKDYLMGKNNPDEQFNLSRLVNLNHNKSKDRYAKKGVLFTPTTESIPSKPINLYNQGCPTTWNIAPEKLKRNDFKIFSTGDAFSILSPEVEVNGANINIHVGLEHASYSPLVLLQEALQLCRCAYEHGAKEVTIALPEQFHPVLHPNDFNLLLMSLFKASGASKLYFYDKNYKGTLDERNNKVIDFALSQQSDPEHYKVGKTDLLDYLHLSSANPSLDEQVMYCTRKNYLNQAWSKFNLSLESIIGKIIPAEIKIPEIKLKPHVLLCCSANIPLAEKIAASLKMRGELVKIYSVEGKGENAVIPKEAEICGALVTIVQSTRPNPNKLAETQEYQINGASSYFFEAAMIARQAHLRGADEINLINPYQFSARSDKAENNPKGKTGAYVQQNGLLFEAAGVNHVITAECHDTHTMSGSYTGKNIRGSAVQALSVIATRVASEWLEDSSHSMRGQLRLVTPDAGATKRTKELTLQLQSLLGKKLCESRILGEKQRDSHQDDSAMINSLNSGAVGINAEDKYLITDDETATGNTLCQAITNLKKNGAKDIAVIVIHNNMPLDWLLRQMCLARFLYLGVNDLHFSDTQEMGTLVTSYEDLIQTYSLIAQLSHDKVEEQVFAWFKKNISEDFSDKSQAYLNQEFETFKSTFSQVQSRVCVHSLGSEFANQVKTRSYVASPVVAKLHEEVAVLPASSQAVYSSTKGALLFFPNQPRPQSKKEMPENDRALAYS